MLRTPFWKAYALGLRWAKSRDSYHRIARELSLRFESLAFVSGHISFSKHRIRSS